MISRVPKWVTAIVLIAIVGVLAWLVIRNKANNPEALIPLSEEVKTDNPEILGVSVDGRDILAFHYGEGDRHVVFVGGIHGGYEWNSVYLAYMFMDYLESNKDILPEGVRVTVIPSANPDGLYSVVGKEGRFNLSDVSKDQTVLEEGRFNANGVDLNRNFDCKWSPKSTWRSRTVSAGDNAFSEPESITIRDFALNERPDAFVFWHSQANEVYESQCSSGVLPETKTIASTYSKASGYSLAQTFDAYAITGDSADWLADQGIPAITVELKTHEVIEWEKNLSGAKALLDYYSR